MTPPARLQPLQPPPSLSPTTAPATPTSSD
jgi:hypothetical protein